MKTRCPICHSAITVPFICSRCSVIFGFGDHDYDNYEGFDAYPIRTMPNYIYDESRKGCKKKEIIYL